MFSPDLAAMVAVEDLKNVWYGIDYQETFAPMALTSVCSLLAIAAVLKWKFFQMDVKSISLHVI
ncbi:hypothetical protein Fmac_031771 [Flemingia macrophylla]|uniref:Uncharacterized protein n=1 Tax=Flemingia macrophylla TaxID=520843 RepID=A0ABD1L310_9FABA